MAFDIPVPVEKETKIQEMTGKLAPSPDEDKLMRTVLENDKKEVDEGNLIEECINQGIGGFSPNLMYEQMVKNFQQAKKLYGERLLRLVTGYDPNYLKRNMKIPEFQREIKTIMDRKFQEMKDKGLVDKEGMITEQGFSFASLIVVLQELDSLMPRGYFGEKRRKQQFTYGIKDDVRDFRRGDRYRDISVRRSIKQAIRHHHGSLLIEDLQAHGRKAKGKVTIVFALDASSSMKGDKLKTCKRAGISLAFNATQNRDEVGIVVFGSEVRTSLEPTDDFQRLLHEIIRIRATTQTNLKSSIEKSIELFPSEEGTKHLVLLTDTKPTAGEKPREETLQAIALARSMGITTSIVGIGLEKDAEELSKKLVEMGEGRLYSIANLDEVGGVVLEDYYAV